MQCFHQTICFHELHTTSIFVWSVFYIYIYSYFLNDDISASTPKDDSSLHTQSNEVYVCLLLLFVWAVTYKYDSQLCTLTLLPKPRSHEQIFPKHCTKQKECYLAIAHQQCPDFPIKFIKARKSLSTPRRRDKGNCIETSRPATEPPPRRPINVRVVINCL